jgi:hypothetical protein
MFGKQKKTGKQRQKERENDRHDKGDTNPGSHANIFWAVQYFFLSSSILFLFVFSSAYLIHGVPPRRDQCVLPGQPVCTDEVSLVQMNSSTAGPCRVMKRR